MIFTRLSKVGGSTLKVGGIVLWVWAPTSKGKIQLITSIRHSLLLDSRCRVTGCLLMLWSPNLPRHDELQLTWRDKISPLSLKLLLLGCFTTATKKVTHTSRNEFSHSYTINRWLQAQNWGHLTHTLANNIACLLSIWLDKGCWVIEDAKQNAGQLSKTIFRMKFRVWQLVVLMFKNYLMNLC